MEKKETRKLPAEVLTEGEVQQLISSCSHRAPTGIRNRALIVMLYRGGLRIAEALALKPKDLDPAAGSVRILRGKGHKPRTVGLDPASFSFIDRWLDVRSQRGINGSARLFCTLKGEEMLPSYVRALFTRIGKKARINKRVHPHGLRHTHAAELCRENVPINIIQKQLGHRSLAVTSQYLDHISPKDVIEAMKKREWNPPQ